jgi:hypothetical protein
VVVNANITPLCKYKKKSDDFHQFTDEDTNKYGFGFYKQKESLYEDSQKFMNIIMNVVNASGPAEEMTPERSAPIPRGVQLQPPAMAANGGASSSATASAVTVHKNQNAHLALGKMTIQAGKVDDASNDAKSGAKSVISGPTGAVHHSHVRFNPETRAFEGLPKEWEGLLLRQFGLEPSQVDSVVVPGYVSRIPSVLLQMRDYLRKENAFQIEGLFRIAADSDECVFVKKALNEGNFVRCDDVHCISNLLKVWFRDLPKAILDPIAPARIESVQTDADVAAIVESLAEPIKSIFLWILDLCVECSSQSDANKMTAKNLGIVFAPNLFIPSMADPMASLRFSQKVANFLGKTISWRASQLV